MSTRTAEELAEVEEWWNNLMRRVPIAETLKGLTLEQRLEGLDLQQSLATLDPQQRLAGLDPQHIVLALPLDALRALPEDYIRTLAPDVQEKIQRRLREETH